VIEIQYENCGKSRRHQPEAKVGPALDRTRALDVRNGELQIEVALCLLGQERRDAQGVHDRLVLQVLKHRKTDQMH
jgi:hypothetical protein